MLPVRSFEEIQFSEMTDKKGHRDKEGDYSPVYRYVSVRLNSTAVTVHVWYSDNSPPEEYEFDWIVDNTHPIYVYNAMAAALVKKHFESTVLPGKMLDQFRGRVSRGPRGKRK